MSVITFGNPVKITRWQKTDCPLELAKELLDSAQKMKKVAVALHEEFLIPYHRFLYPFVDELILSGADSLHFASQLKVDVSGLSLPLKNAKTGEGQLIREFSSAEILWPEEKKSFIFFVCSVSPSVWALPPFQIRQLSKKILSFEETAVRILRKNGVNPLYAGGGCILFFARPGKKEEAAMKIKKCFFDLLGEMKPLIRHKMIEK